MKIVYTLRIQSVRHIYRTFSVDSTVAAVGHRCHGDPGNEEIHIHKESLVRLEHNYIIDYKIQ